MGIKWTVISKYLLIGGGVIVVGLVGAFLITNRQAALTTTLLTAMPSECLAPNNPDSKECDDAIVEQFAQFNGSTIIQTSDLNNICSSTPIGGTSASSVSIKKDGGGRVVGIAHEGGYVCENSAPLNKLTKFGNIFALKKITEIRFINEAVTETLPPTISDSILKLDVRGIQVAGPIPQLPPSLFFFVAPGNNFIGSYPVLPVGMKIENCYLKDNPGLSGTVPADYQCEIDNRVQDTTNPTVTITGQGSDLNLTTSSSTYSLQGTASDNVAVSRVEIKKGGVVTVASGTTNWTSTLTLAVGRNVFSVQSVDSSGNRSGSINVIITRRR